MKAVISDSQTNKLNLLEKEVIKIYKNVNKGIKCHTTKMLSNNSPSQLTGTLGHTAFSVNVGTGIIVQVNYSFNITLLPQGKV